MHLQTNKKSFCSVLEDIEGLFLKTKAGLAGELVCHEEGDPVAVNWGDQPSRNILLVQSLSTAGCLGGDSSGVGWW